MASVTRAASLEELEPLLTLCRTGKLFEVIEWVKQGRPVALPDGVGAKGARRNPLRIGMERGFHSVVQALLEAGAPLRVGSYNALEHAVDLRRPDLAAMLVRHGARVADVNSSRNHCGNCWGRQKRLPQKGKPLVTALA